MRRAVEDTVGLDLERQVLAAEARSRGRDRGRGARGGGIRFKHTHVHKHRWRHEHEHRNVHLGAWECEVDVRDEDRMREVRRDEHRIVYHTVTHTNTQYLVPKGWFTG